MNTVILSGNLASDTSLKATQNGKEMCTFRLAVNDGWGENRKTSFLHILTFGKTATNCDRFLSKGRKVLIRGRIQTGSYEKSDGSKVYTTDIIADEVEFLSGSDQTPDAPKEEVQPPEIPKREQIPFDMPEGFSELEEELPF